MCPEVRREAFQRLGGWKSLVVMQDTYRGVLESLEEIELVGLDRFDETWVFDSLNEADEVAEAGETLNVDMATWRARSQVG